MKIQITVAAALFFAMILIAGCNGDGGSGGESNGDNPAPGNAVLLSGTVSNNHTDEDAAHRAVAKARVVLIMAGDVEEINSVSPVEDLAKGNNGYPSAKTDSHGYYEFKQDDFSDANPADEKYFIFVEPPTSSDAYWPGGSASRTSITLDGKTAVDQDIELSDKNGPNAAYIGTSNCLFCHPDKKHTTHTLHFVGIRKVGPNGTIANKNIDMSDTSVYDLSANNDEMLDKFTSPATHYTFADDTGKSFWLGKDAVGLYFQLTSNTNPKFYVKYSYGGETGLWKGHFMTTVYANTGTYAEKHGQEGDDYAYYVMSPIQYNEDQNSIYGEKFVIYYAERWDFAGTGNKGFTADPELDSFDLQCAACHGATRIQTVNQGLATQRNVAVFPKDKNGYDFDGTSSEINTGCEKCHGPGSNHLAVGGRGHAITLPDQLPAGRLTMICGTCHIRGDNHTDIGGGAALKADGRGDYSTFRPGLTPAQFFGASDGTGRNISPFGTLEIASLTENGYLEPVNFETDAKASWIDILFGADVNHSKENQQQYEDLVRSVKFKNQKEILTCISCHDAHGSSHGHMLIYSVDNNAVCLSCHHGPGEIFPNINNAMVSRLKNGKETPADKEAIGEDVEAHIFDKTGTLQMSPYDPEGTAMGRCILCHMPKTAKSADWTNALDARLGQYLRGDISSHTFDVMSTQAVNDMAGARGITDTTPAGISDKCGSCHVNAGLN